MKKLVACLAFAGLFIFGTNNVVMAQEATEPQASEQTENEATVTEQPVAAAAPVVEEEVVVEKPFNQVLKDKFIEGGVGFMTPILLALILGLALVIERTIYLNLATTDTKKLLAGIEEALKNGNVEKAKEICRNTRGPVASVFYQGLDRYDEGNESIEKAVISYGGVQTGFLGTVVGMVQAFDDIEKAGDISPTIVAGGMKVALITTVTGLIVAIILQVFYSYLVSKIDSLVTSMEDATISYMDILVKYRK